MDAPVALLHGALLEKWNVASSRGRASSVPSGIKHRATTDKVLKGKTKTENSGQGMTRGIAVEMLQICPVFYTKCVSS
jgi:hypothetical protein